MSLMGIRSLCRLCSVLLLLTVAVFVQPAPAHALNAGKGIQLGHIVKVDSAGCERSSEVALFMNDPEMLAATSWLRIDFRAAGGPAPGQTVACPDVEGAYRSLLDELLLKAPHIWVIGAMTQDFIWGLPYTNTGLDAPMFAAAASDVACDDSYSKVKVWEIWNEPNFIDTRLEPPVYAELLGLTATEIRHCNREPISGGVVGSPDPVAYLNDVDDEIAVHRYGGNTDLISTVSGIGIHPYVSAINIGDPGHQPLEDFLYAIGSAYPTRLFVTEFGWKIEPGIDEAKQCYNLLHGFDLLDNSAVVQAATWFTFRDFGDADRLYGLYDLEGPRLALNGYKTGSCDPLPPVCPPPSALSGFDIGIQCVPATPSNPAVTAVSGTGIQVRWTDNSGDESGFQIDNGVSTVSVGPNVTAYVWTGLSPGTYMCFRVRAFSSDGYTAYTAWACTSTPTVPAAPSSPTATAVNGNSIRISWTDNSNNESGFRIFNGVTNSFVGANATTLVWHGLSPGTYMCFSVAAYNNAGASASTPYACATTPTVPNAPGNPTATAVNGNSIRISWTDNSNNESGFRIFNGVTNSFVGANATTLVWHGLSPGTYMCFSVAAYNNAGASASTPYACATTPTVPNAPGNPTATAVNSNSIRVNWTDRSGNETGFQVYNGVNSVYLGANDTSFTWGGLSAGTYMCFAIRSYNSAGYSAWTPWACTSTPSPPAAPSQATATAISGSQIHVTWRDNSGSETGFQVYNGVNSVYLGANDTSFTWGGLSTGTYMCFAIRSYNSAGYSAWTPWACTSTPSPPAAPSLQQAVAQSTSTIWVTWRDNSHNENSFQVFDGVNYFWVSAGNTGFLRTGLTSRTYMCFAIRAHNSAGYSAWTPYTCSTTF